MQKKLSKLSQLWFITSMFFVPQKNALHAAPTLKEMTLYTAGAATAAYLGYLACSKPAKFTPTFDALQALSAVPIEQQDIPEITNIATQTPVCSAPPTPRASTVAKGLCGIIAATQPFIISVNEQRYMMTEGVEAINHCPDTPCWINICGWDPCSGRDTARGINENIRLGIRGLGNHIIHGPALFIAHNDTRRVFNFGQNTDQQNIDFVYRQAMGRDIIWNARCKGACSLLGWMQQYPSDDTVRAVILESPTLSLNSTCLDVSTRFTHSKIAGTLIHRLFAFYYPNYSTEKAAEQEKINPLKLAPNVPIFIGNIKEDPISADERVTSMVKQLRKQSENPVYYYVCHEPITHAYLNRCKEYQRVVNAFLKKYNLPHDESLASQGTQLLIEAQERAEALTKDKTAL